MHEEGYLRSAVIVVYYCKLFISFFLWLPPCVDVNYAHVEFGSKKYANKRDYSLVPLNDSSFRFTLYFSTSSLITELSALRQDIPC